MSEEQAPYGKQSFKNAREIAAYLKASGWKCSQSSVYAHEKQGKIKAEPDGAYSLKQVLKYARNFLMMGSAKQKLDDDDLQRKKLKVEILRTEEQAKLAQVKRMAEEGRYILRSDFELELAARAATLEANLKFLIQDRASDWIHLVAGNRKAAPDLIRTLHDEIDTLLNEFSSEKEWKIVLSKPEPSVEDRTLESDA